MREAPRPIPPIDPRWLELLCQRCTDLRGGGARFEDLFLEQRLELRAVASGNELHVEEIRLEGAAARWQSPSRVVLHARTGLSARAIGELLDRHADRVALPPTRPALVPEMDPPRGWLEWAREVASRLQPAPCVVRYLSRRAALVRAGSWTPISTPSLVRVEHSGNDPSALLAVWGHRKLGSWLQSLVDPAPGRRWAPSPGTQIPVLFREGTAGVLMHELVGHMAESDLVATKVSPLAGLMGANITAVGIEITDDPTRFDLAGGFDFDDEGTLAEPIAVVRGGRFERLLCDRTGALQLKSEAGRGRRAMWSRPPVARLSNLVVTTGSTSPEDMESDLDHGFVVTRLGRAAVDPVSSRTVLRVERGWEVRHGRRRRPLAPCELTGSVVEILANIDPRVGSDATPDWRLGWCVKNGVPLPTGSEAPSMLVNRLEVL